MSNVVAAVSFNTHAVVKQLIAAKFTEQQAETVCDVMQDLQSSASTGFATKQDISELRHTIADFRKDTKQDISDLRKDTQQGISDLRHEMQGLYKDMEIKLEQTKFSLVKWLVTLAIAQTGLLFTLMKLFPKIGS